jgi:hypothetical protein
VSVKLREFASDRLRVKDLEAEGYDIHGANTAIRSPSPSANLFGHPYFREEFTLPPDEAYEAMISQRRMRATASLPSSSPSPVAESKSRIGKKRSRTKMNMAGLVGGDSDSSALTQESGDEGAVGTPITATDGGTENLEDEDVDMRELSRGRHHLHLLFNFKLHIKTIYSSFCITQTNQGQKQTRKERGRGTGTRRRGVKYFPARKETKARIMTHGTPMEDLTNLYFYFFASAIPN